jgi:hypothetical protein
MITFSQNPKLQCPDIGCHGEEMNLSKKGLRERQQRPQDSVLFGIIDNVTLDQSTTTSEPDLPVPTTREARRHAQAPLLKAEYWKGRAIMLVRQNAYT